jgi:hypothetical protein
VFSADWLATGAILSGVTNEVTVYDEQLWNCPIVLISGRELQSGLATT